MTNMTKQILFFWMLLSLFASAEVEQFPFIGVTVSTHTVDINTPKESFSNDEVITGIRYGQQTLKWRTMFTYEFEQNGFETFTLEVDKILKDGIYGSAKVRPYAGLAFGTVSYVNEKLKYDINATKKSDSKSDKDKDSEDSFEVDTSGYFYGLSFGFIVYITDTLDLDLSYHYYDVIEFENLNNIQGFALSLHYFY